jgi:hypothetical protein
MHDQCRSVNKALGMGRPKMGHPVIRFDPGKYSKVLEYSSSIAALRHAREIVRHHMYETKPLWSGSLGLD